MLGGSPPPLRPSFHCVCLSACVCVAPANQRRDRGRGQGQGQGAGVITITLQCIIIATPPSHPSPVADCSTIPCTYTYTERHPTKWRHKLVHIHIHTNNGFSAGNDNEDVLVIAELICCVQAQLHIMLQWCSNCGLVPQVRLSTTWKGYFLWE